MHKFFKTMHLRIRPVQLLSKKTLPKPETANTTDLAFVNRAAIPPYIIGLYCY